MILGISEPNKSKYSCTVFQAEVAAILRVTTVMNELNFGGKNLSKYTDWEITVSEQKPL